jgi:hypothetical protein
MKQSRFEFMNDTPPRHKWIFRPWITDPKTGIRRYPKNGRVFKLLVKIEN